MQIKINKTFESRDELDSYVKNNFGENPDNNRDIVMELGADEMAALSLSEDTTVHGVRITPAVEETNDNDNG